MSQYDLKQIDPALGLMSEFSKISKGTSNKIQQMRVEAILTDGIFPAKVKALMAALWGVSVRCEPCLKFYILKAKTLGATEEEVGEILAIGSAMGGCVGEMWGLKAYGAFRGDEEGECCV